MTYRAAKFLATGFISCLAAATLLAASHKTVEAAGDCLAAPKGAAPQGGHWYYRIDRTTKRQCWYVRNEARPSQQASKPSPSPAAPVAIALQDSVANARAELPAGPAPEERSVAAQDQRATEVTSGDGVASSPANPNAGGWSLASRWSNADAGDSGKAAAGSDSTDAKQQLQAAATRPTAEVAGNDLWALLASLGGALLVAGVAIAGVVTFFRTRPTTSGETGMAPRPERSHDAGQIQSNVRSRDEPVMNWVRIAREIEAAKNPGRDVEELLARMPRRPLA